MLIKIAQINSDTQQLPECLLPWEESTDWLWEWLAARRSRRHCCPALWPLSHFKCTRTFGCLLRLGLTCRGWQNSCSEALSYVAPKTPVSSGPNTFEFQVRAGFPSMTQPESLLWVEFSPYSHQLTVSPLKGLLCNKEAAKNALFLLHWSQPC